MKLRELFNLFKFKLCNKVLVLGFNNIKLGNHGKWQVPDFGGQSLDTDSDFSRCWHF